MMKASTRYIKDNNNMINPFVVNLTINVRYKPVNDKITDSKLIELEADRYCKLFVYNDNKHILRSLPANSLQLYFYIITELRNGEDIIRINRKQYMNELNIKSLTTVADAIKVLIDKGIICATSERELYWINPAIIFCGSRPNKYPDNIKIVK